MYVDHHRKSLFASGFLGPTSTYKRRKDLHVKTILRSTLESGKNIGDEYRESPSLSIIHVSVCLSVCPSLSLPICLSVVRLCLCLFVSARLPLSLSLSLPPSLSISLSISFSLSFCRSFRYSIHSLVQNEKPRPIRLNKHTKNRRRNHQSQNYASIMSFVSHTFFQDVGEFLSSLKIPTAQTLIY